VLLYRSTVSGFTVPPLFDIDHLRLRPSLFDLFIEEDGCRKNAARVCIPNRSTKSPERKREQKKRWFRNGQKWRTGCEGRVSVVKRRHGLTRCRYRGEVGMKRWVGLGVIADNLINIGRAIQNEGDP
jgi:hypothetical protein